MDQAFELEGGDDINDGTHELVHHGRLRLLPPRCRESWENVAVTHIRIPGTSRVAHCWGAGSGVTEQGVRQLHGGHGVKQGISVESWDTETSLAIELFIMVFSFPMHSFTCLITSSF